MFVRTKFVPHITRKVLHLFSIVRRRITHLSFDEKIGNTLCSSQDITHAFTPSVSRSCHDCSVPPTSKTKHIYANGYVPETRWLTTTDGIKSNTSTFESESSSISMFRFVAFEYIYTLGNKNLSTCSFYVNSIQCIHVSLYFKCTSSNVRYVSSSNTFYGN